jgi:COMPASS component SPP1
LFQTTALDPAVQAIVDGWVNNEIDSATAITDPEHPFFVHSNNASTFKYKYPEAKPTPPGEDDVVWNRTYTAADSRMYNKNGKDHNNSRKIRASGDTYTLSLQIHWENKQKFAKKHANPLDPGSILVGKAAPKPKPASTKPNHPTTTTTTMESATRLEDSMDGIDLNSMSISEKIKSKEGKRKASSVAALAMQRSSPPSVAGPSVAGPSSAGPSSAQTMSNSTPDVASPTSPKVDKAKPTKKSTKKAKKAAPASKLILSILISLVAY